MYILLFFVISIIPLSIKLLFIFTYFKTLKIFLLIQLLLHDSLIYLLLISLTYLSYISKKYTFKITLRLFSLSIFLIYLFDCLVWIRFATHLTIEDLFKFIDYLPSYIEQYSTISHIILFISLFIAFLYYIFKNISIDKKIFHLPTIGVILLLSVSYLFAGNNSYIHSWLYKNVFEYNYELLSKQKNYSNEFIKNFKFEEEKTLHTPNSTEHNIIVLMVESFASYQSKLFSGVNNWTPNLDKIASDNIYFKNFFANGYITEHAEISILTGKLPIVPPKIFSKDDNISFNGFYNIKNSIPNLLKKSNYDTEFITSSDLKFSNTGDWVRSIGFDYIEGSDHPSYKNLPKFHFYAPADEYLLKRVVKRVEKKRDNPFFIFVKTVSSHVPFINPENKKRSEEETIKYVDKQLGIFYKKLQNIGFFKNNGILIIVGDHHPAIPVKEEAEKKLGKLKATAAVPMVISFDNTKKLVKSQFQQTDIYNTILNYSNTKYITNDWIGVYNNEKIISPKYVLYKRIDNRSIFSVFNNENIYNVLLNGDDTSIVYSTKDNIDEKKDILAKINFERIRKRDKNIVHKDDLIERKGFPISILQK